MKGNNIHKEKRSFWGQHKSKAVENPSAVYVNEEGNSLGISLCFVFLVAS
jgi:hypothetical protein